VYILRMILREPHKRAKRIYFAEFSLDLGLTS
jgi:hypothetical protein